MGVDDREIWPGHTWRARYERLLSDVHKAINHSTTQEMRAALNEAISSDVI